MNHARPTPTTALAALALLACASVASAQRAPEEPDPTWVSVEGEVIAIDEEERVRLRHEDGEIIVELQGFTSDDRRPGMLRGQEVIVYGAIDPRPWLRTLDAFAIYVPELGTYFHAGDEARAAVARWSPPSDGERPDLGLRGTVRSIEDGEVTVILGSRTVTLSTEELSFDPLDDEGYVQLDVGDRVEAWGELRGDLFAEAPELVMERVVVIGSSDESVSES